MCILGAQKFGEILDNILAHGSCFPEIDGLKYRVRVHPEHFPPHFIIIFDSLNFPYMQNILKSCGHYLNMCAKLGTSIILFLLYFIFKYIAFEKKLMVKISIFPPAV